MARTEYIYYCPKCKETYSAKVRSWDEKMWCDICHEQLVPENITLDEWNQKSQDEKESMKNGFQLSLEKAAAEAEERKKPKFEKHNDYIKYISEDLIAYKSINDDKVNDDDYNNFPIQLKKDAIVAKSKGIFKESFRNIQSSKIKKFYMYDESTLKIADYIDGDPILTPISSREQYEDICKEAVDFAHVDNAAINRSKYIYSYFLLAPSVFLLGFIIALPIIFSSDRKEGITLSLCFFAVFAVLIGGYIIKKIVTTNKEIDRQMSPTNIGYLKIQVEKFSENKDYYLEQYKEDVEYDKLKAALDELPAAYNKYALEILGTTKVGKAPINPYAAAAIGNQVAGLGGAIIMGSSAQQAQDQYNDRLETFRKQLVSINSAGDKVVFLVDEINSIVMRNVIPK